MHNMYNRTTLLFMANFFLPAARTPALVFSSSAAESRDSCLRGATGTGQGGLGLLLHANCRLLPPFAPLYLLKVHFLHFNSK